MADELGRPIVLDATVFSNFASSSSVDQIAEIFDKPVTVPAVRNELERGRRHGHEFLDTALAQIGSTIPVLSIDDEARALTREFRDRLDHGESVALAAAIEHNGTLATDDLAARRVAGARQVPVTGSIGILVSGIRRDIITTEAADNRLRTWREERGYYAPIDDIDDALG